MMAAGAFRARAAAALDADEDASLAEARDAFLKRLTADGFVPPEEAVWAANALAGVKLSLSLGGWAEAAATEAEIVDGFSRAYWSVPPDQRRERWHSLNAMLTDAEAKSRMAELEAGLGFDTAPHENPSVESVSAAIRELYVLRPRERVVRRTGWLFEHCDQQQELRAAAQRLRLERSGLSLLVPSVSVQLECDSPLKFIGPLDPALSLVDPAEADEYDANRVARPSTADPVQSNSKGCMMLLIGPVAALVVLVASQYIPSCHWGKKDTRPQFRYEPAATAPDYPVFRQFTVEDLRSFWEYEQRQARGEKDGIPPPKYMLWRLPSESSGKQTKR